VDNQSLTDTYTHTHTHTHMYTISLLLLPEWERGERERLCG